MAPEAVHGRGEAPDDAGKTVRLELDISAYDPFAAGPFAVISRTFVAQDSTRDRNFPVDVWSPPDEVGPLVIYSHHSGGNRRAATFLYRHLASHGYVVAAMDHSEVVAREQLPLERSRRIEAIIAARVPDVRFLIDQFGRDEVGLAGHSFGGWAVLATAEVDERVASLVAMAPGGASKPRPGILPLKLTLRWPRRIPTLYLAAENDVSIPASSVRDLWRRTRAPKRMFTLHRADHQHFLDDVEGAHEAVRHATFPAEAAWIPLEMRPVGELVSGEEAHAFVRSLTLAHFDATLRQSEPAQAFLDGDVKSALATHGVDAMPSSRSRSSRR